MKKITFLVGMLCCSKLSVLAQFGWNNVGPGTNLSVDALATDTTNKLLYVGGVFSQAGSVPTLGIAKWDGVAYSGLGLGIIVGSGIYSLLVMPNGDLIAGGSFTNIDGVLSKNISRWNGTTWSPLGLGLDSTGAAVVRALALYKNELYAGGIFSNSGGSPINFIAKWNGSNWLPLTTGTNGKVLSLAVYNNELYVGGTFTNAGGVAVNNIAKWDSTAWSDVGGGVNYTGAISVSALQVYGGNLFAGGTFNQAGLTPVNHIAQWDGVTWSDVGGGASDYTGAISVSALQVFNGSLVAGGTFDSLGTNPANFIGQWNGTSWSNMGLGMNNPVNALAAMKDTLYAGGLFTTAGGSSANFIAEWVPSFTTANSTGNLNSNSTYFAVFPNPSQNTVHIRANTSGAIETKNFNFILTDALGREISEAESVNGSVRLERKNISAGLYFYKIVSRENTLLQEGKIIFAD